MHDGGFACTQAGEYINTSATYTSDRVCLPYTVCGQYESVAVNGTASSDVECEPEPEPQPEPEPDTLIQTRTEFQDFCVMTQFMPAVGARGWRAQTSLQPLIHQSTHKRHKEK